MTARLARSLAFAAALGAAGSPGWAATALAAAPKKDPAALAEELGAKARDAFKSRRFDRAIELYLEAYENAPDAGFLFNIAFIYDKKLGELDLARDYYRRVVAFPEADADLVAKAQARMVEIEQTLAEIGPGGDVKPPDGDVKPPGGDVKPPGGDVKPPGGDVKPPGGDVKPPGGAGEGDADMLPWVIVGGGGLLFVTGAAFGLVASGTESDFAAATDNGRRRELQSTGQTQAALADVFMGLGLAAIGTGLVIWLGASDDDARGSVHVAPALINGGAAFVVGGAL